MNTVLRGSKLRSGHLFHTCQCKGLHKLHFDKLDSNRIRCDLHIHHDGSSWEDYRNAPVGKSKQVCRLMSLGKWHSCRKGFVNILDLRGVFFIRKILIYHVKWKQINLSPSNKLQIQIKKQLKIKIKLTVPLNCASVRLLNSCWLFFPLKIVDVTIRSSSRFPSRLVNFVTVVVCLCYCKNKQLIVKAIQLTVQWINLPLHRSWKLLFLCSLAYLKPNGPGRRRQGPVNIDKQRLDQVRKICAHWVFVDESRDLQ